VDPTPTDNELFDLHTLADYGKRGVLLLLSDSTNSDRPGYTESERAVRPRMEEIFNRAERRVWSRASVPRSIAFSWCSTWRRNTAAAWP
jgi:ribonuclease J